MYAETNQDNTTGSSDRAVKDNSAEVDQLLEGLTDGQVGQRIIEAAHLAAARHMLSAAQEMRSAVEAETSTQ